jgi:hypothetical protein
MRTDVVTNLPMQLAKALDSTRTVSKSPYVVKVLNEAKDDYEMKPTVTLKQWVYTIGYLNSQNKDTQVVNGEAIEGFKVPNCLSGLIMPSGVTATGSLKDVDFMVKECCSSLNKDEILSQTAFNIISQGILANWKQGGTLVPFKRENQLLTANTDKFSYKGKVQGYGQPFMPVALSINLVDETQLCVDESSLIEEWLLQTLSAAAEGKSNNN